MTILQSKLKVAFTDLEKVIDKKQVWLALGWNDVQSRYNRSRLGVFWASLSILIFVSALGPIYAQLFEANIRDYMLHLMLGMVVWNYISAIIMDSGREYINSTHYMVSFQLSYFTLLFRVVWRNLIVLGYQMLVFIILALALGLPIKIAWLITPVSILTVTSCALWMGLLTSVLATRYRDFSELLNNILRLVFFVTPIMWMPGMKPELEAIAQLNPFYHLIEIFRSPFLSGIVNGYNWVVVMGLLLIGWLIAFPVFVKYRSRIAFWV